MKILLVASTGGHLAQLLTMREWWSQHERHWVTFQKPDAIAALEDEAVTWAHHPVTRNLPNAMRNLGLAVTTLRRLRPDVVVSTGAGVSLPFFVVARLLRIHTVYLEVFDRIDSPTLTGRLSYPISDAMCGQWPQQRAIYPEALVIGPAL
ncbi:UDP-N-acetylglucosamine--LPS N-acetylglucosamine transferase [Amnibacterium sp. CER49]|uniref:UDP-N-acetylglucosamine--LPS N-acetylglucosamine transferase n=1 Tax=Amnibacterium sp. CER49 TaxID=3039161 RepID=UPI00244B062E|nr:UDP-N-acetylglucosamine--LPS N-acetylglucosamine transferase [Amnibacterium sp. CER49]MDH2443054.1 UDP-N-acetylglucosamine--LPS N-acetylglucosamine transferase [Amnibacterium sp. CER49]